jgi:hypothetical protein
MQYRVAFDYDGESESVMIQKGKKLNERKI